MLGVPPVVTVSAVSLSLLAGDATTFTAAPVGRIRPYTASGSIGDGSTRSRLVVGHAVSTAGTYDVNCSLVDSIGDTTNAGLTVADPAPSSGSGTRSTRGDGRTGG
jgi:hypothetical protein